MCVHVNVYKTRGCVPIELTSPKENSAYISTLCNYILFQMRGFTEDRKQHGTLRDSKNIRQSSCHHTLEGPSSAGGTGVSDYGVWCWSRSWIKGELRITTMPYLVRLNVAVKAISRPPGVGEGEAVGGVVGVEQVNLALFLAILQQLHAQLIVDGVRPTPHRDLWCIVRRQKAICTV